MVILRFILWVLAFFTTLLWFTKLTTDCVSAMFGGSITTEQATTDGAIRVILVALMSIFWALVIMIN